MIDNQAVVRWCQTPPHRECADRGLWEFIYSSTQGNPIPMRWIPGHRGLVQARSRQVREDIRRNNEVDRWAKKAAGLPLRNVDPTDVSHIVIRGGHAPTPARKWILAYRNILGFRGAHWMTWLPLKEHADASGIPGCGIPCYGTPAAHHGGQHHSTTAHQRLVSCPKWRPSFINLWTHSWGEWHQQAHKWLLTATVDDLKQISCPRIPDTFIDTLPSKAKKNISH